MKKNFDLFSIFIFIVIVLECILLTQKPFQNDTFYTIKIGNFISEHGIDFKDHYSNVSGLSYTYPHWLYDLFVYKVYNLFGFFGLYVMNIILYVGLILIVYFILKKFTKNRFISFLYSILCCYYMRDFIATRAQQVTIILFLLFLFCLHKLVIENKKIYGIFCFLITVLIANLHCAVWPFTFVLFLPFFAEVLVLKIISKRKINKQNELFEDKFIFDSEINFKYLLTMFIVCIFSGILTPLRFAPYTYLIKTMRGSSMSFISEHQPIVLIDYPFSCIFLILLLFIFFIKSKFKFRELFMIMGLFILCLTSTRHLIFLLSIAGIYLVIILIRTILKYDKFTLDYIEKIFSKKIILIPILLLLSLYTIYSYKNNKDVFIPVSEYPVNCVKWMDNNLNKDNIKIFNLYNYGSYLLFNNYKVFIDSRADLYTPEFNEGYDILFDSLNIGHIALQEKYNFTHYIVLNSSHEANILMYDSNYYKIYSDNYFSIYEYKKNTLNNSLLIN